MSQSDMAIDPDAAGVGPAQCHRLGHFCDDVPVCIEIAIEANPTSYSAHRVTFPFHGWIDRRQSFLFCEPQGYPLRKQQRTGRTQNQSAASEWILPGTGHGAVATGERWSI
jgi:hypothetical protein